jgi:hypothetical protein
MDMSPCFLIYFRSVRILLIFSFLIGITHANRAEAQGISIRSRMTLSVLSDRITVNLEAINAGDAAGRKIHAVLRIFDRILKSPPLDRLDAGKSHTFFFTAAIPENRRGQFAFIGEVIFHDNDLHPFSAVSGGTFLLKNRYPSLIHGRCPDLSFEKEKRFTVYVKNASPRPQTVKATLYLPNALVALETEKRFKINANEETGVVFEIKYRYHSGSAVYPFYCALEYEQNQNHHASLVQSSARIMEPADWYAETRWYWLAGLGGICLIWMGYPFMRQRAWGRGQKA